MLGWFLRKYDLLYVLSYVFGYSKVQVSRCDQSAQDNRPAGVLPSRTGLPAAAKLQ